MLKTKKKASYWKYFVIGIVIISILALIGKVKQATQETRSLREKLENQQSVESKESVKSGATYKVELSQESLNQLFNENLKNIQTGNNYVTSVKVILKEGSGAITANWLKGQTLTADLVVSANGKELEVVSVKVTGTGVFQSTFEKIAKDFLDKVLASYAKSQGEKLAKLELKTGALLIYYKLQ